MMNHQKPHSKIIDLSSSSPIGQIGQLRQVGQVGQACQACQVGQVGQLGQLGQGGFELTPASMTRRSLFKHVNGAVLAATLGGVPFASFSDELKNMSPGRGPNIPKWPEPHQTRQIWLVRQETGETIVARYFDNRRIHMPGYLAVCNLLRDVRSGTVVHIDVELMDLIFAIQSWLVSWGIDIPMMVTSGYRSLRTNSMLEGAARNSLHTQGKAIDVRMRGVPVEYLGRLASIFSAGGVGFYTDRNFNHLDTGNVRYWRGR